MSWSVAYVGTPDNVVKALEAESARLTGASKKEFDEALPHLVGLVRQNFAPTTGGPVGVKLDASGSGTSDAVAPITRSCRVSIEQQSHPRFVG